MGTKRRPKRGGPGRREFRCGTEGLDRPSPIVEVIEVPGKSAAILSCFFKIGACGPTTLHIWLSSLLRVRGRRTKRARAHASGGRQALPFERRQFAFMFEKTSQRSYPADSRGVSGNGDKHG